MFLSTSMMVMISYLEQYRYCSTTAANRRQPPPNRPQRVMVTLQEATDILLSHRPTLVLAASPQATPQALAVAREVAWVVTAIAERDATFVSGGGSSGGGGSGGTASAAGAGAGGEESGRALALAELMLMCLASSNRSTADAALDYFSAINTVSRGGGGGGMGGAGDVGVG